MSLRGWYWILFTVLIWGTLGSVGGVSTAAKPSAEEMRDRAVTAYRDKLYPLAESHILAFLEQLPHSPYRLDMIYLLGRAYFLQEEFDRSRETFLSLINDDDVNRVNQTSGLFWLAESCTQLDRWKEAKAYYMEFIGQASSSPFLGKSFFALGLICLKEKALQEAETYFSKAVRVFPRGQYTPQIQHYRGLIYGQWGNYHRAVQLLREAISSPAGLPPHLRKEAVFYLAENRLKLGHFQLALHHYTDFYTRYPDDPRASLALYGAAWCQLKTGRREVALESFQDLIEQFPKSEPSRRALFRVGEIQLERANYENAREAFAQIAREGTDHALLVEALINLGWCHLNLGELDKMTRVAHRLIKLPAGQREKSLAQLFLGEAHFQRGEYEDALPYFFNLLNTPSQRENALYKISRCYFYGGEYKDAITNVEILLLEYPDSRHLEECLYLSGRAASHLGEIEKAIASYDEILKSERRDPWTAAALYEMGKIYYERKDLKKAKELFVGVFDTTHELETTILASYYLGIIHHKEKSTSEALRYLNDALESGSPAIKAECHYRIGQIYFEKKAYPLSLHHFKTVVDNLSDQRGWMELALFEMGNVLLAHDESAEARKAFQRVLEESDDPDLRQASERMLASIEKTKPEP